MLTPNGKSSALKLLVHILERIFLSMKAFNLAEVAKCRDQAFNQLHITNIILMQTFISLTDWLDTATSKNVRHDYGRNIAESAFYVDVLSLAS